MTVSLITERRVSQPWGLAGGEPGAVGENWLLPGGDEARAERLAGQVHDPAARRRRRCGCSPPAAAAGEPDEAQNPPHSCSNEAMTTENGSFEGVERALRTY